MEIVSMSTEFSAVHAMNGLLAQIEERLNQTEDYRALRALQRAIADVAAQAALAPVVRMVAEQPPTVILPQAAAQMPRVSTLPPAPGSHTDLMQRLTASFPGMSTAKAVPARKTSAA
jgi:hypothetical protein